ncbi:MAG: tRNA lysidine(34) synthetase TilS [Candidatus Bipolaricaulia bacterium]
MLNKVRETIARYRMLAPGERVLTAVSGGVDSIVLLHLFYELREELKINLIVAHLDHRIRGEESRADAESVAAEAQRLGLPLVLEESDAPAYAKEEGLSLEEAAREVRYRFLEEAAAKVRADKIALGHQRDDLVETLLINLIRGAGLVGLRGMVPVRGRYIRPLIKCSRTEIERFAGEHRLEYRQDRTNLEKKYLRNRIRLELLPLLENYRPGVAARLAQTAQVLGEAAHYLEERARERLEGLVLGEGDDELVLDREKLLEEEPIIRAFILREAVRRARGTLRDIEFAHLQKMSKLIEGDSTRAECHLPGGLRFRRSGERLSIAPAQQEAEPQPYELPLQIGENYLPEIGWRFTLEEAEPRLKSAEDPLRELIDHDRIEEPLLIRSWRPGDRLRPLGMAGTKKVQDLFVDEKVPPEERGRVPLFCDRRGIIWVVGIRLSEDYKVTEKTKRALLITARRL